MGFIICSAVLRPDSPLKLRGDCPLFPDPFSLLQHTTAGLPTRGPLRAAYCPFRLFTATAHLEGERDV